VESGSATTSRSRVSVTEASTSTPAAVASAWAAQARVLLARRRGCGRGRGFGRLLELHGCNGHAMHPRSKALMRASTREAAFAVVLRFSSRSDSPILAVSRTPTAKASTARRSWPGQGATSSPAARVALREAPPRRAGGRTGSARMGLAHRASGAGRGRAGEAQAGEAIRCDCCFSADRLRRRRRRQGRKPRPCRRLRKAVGSRPRPEREAAWARPPELLSSIASGDADASH